MATKPNPLFTRSEKRRMKRRAKHAVRSGFAKLFGIPLSRGLGQGAPAGTSGSRRAARRSRKPSSGVTGSSSVRGDVIEALRGQGYNASTAKKMASSVQSGDSFESAFRRVFQKNPGELIIFGNPEHVFTRAGIQRAMRKKNIVIPASVLSGLQFGVGEQALSAAAKSGKKPHRKKNLFGLFRKGATREKVDAAKRQEAHDLLDSGHYFKAARVHRMRRRKYARKAGIQMEGMGTRAKRHVRKKVQRAAIRGIRRLFGNPDGQAEQLFETFHHRPASGTYETQRAHKDRKEFTILGPLVAIGVNAPHFDEVRRRMGKTNFESYKVDHWDKLPHLGFLTGAQIEWMKRIIEDPDKYVRDCPQLASSPNGKQLYAITPDGVQVDLKQFDTDTSKDFVDLGEATFVVYLAKKPDEAVEWIHELGEDGGVRPRLMLKRLGRGEIFFTGGTYTVEGPGIMH